MEIMCKKIKKQQNKNRKMVGKMNISKMREYAFMLIYELEVQKEYSEENVELFIENNEIDDKDARKYIRKIIKGIKENEVEIEKNIKDKLKPEWSLERISKINIALLKLAIYEMLYADVPYKVAINEVVELAKKYGDNNSAPFINGVLANVVKENL